MILKNPIDRQYLQLVQSDGGKKLSVFFAALCVIDLFGVFPIVTLPKSLISCGYYGFPLIIFVFTLQTYTAVVLGRLLKSNTMCVLIKFKITQTVNSNTGAG
jgi:hypothetical protein